MGRFYEIGMQGERNEIETTDGGCDSEEGIEIIRNNKIINKKECEKFFDSDVYYLRIGSEITSVDPRTGIYINDWGTISEEDDDDEKSEKEEKCVKKKLKNRLTLNRKIKVDKLHLYPQVGNTTWNSYDKVLSKFCKNSPKEIEVSIPKGGSFQISGFKVMNNKKKNNVANVTKTCIDGKKITFICK